MNARLFAAASKLSPQAWWLLVLLVGGAVALEGWLLVLREPVNTYREVSAARESLRAMEEMMAAQQADSSEPACAPGSLPSASAPGWAPRPRSSSPWR